MSASVTPGAESTPAERTSPYQGLVPYGEEDAEWFFGRDEWRETIIDTLRAYRVSVLYGASGVGKSSLLRASVLPQLRSEAHNDVAALGTPDVVSVAFADWSLADPLAALKGAVARAVADLAPVVADDPPQGTVADVLARWSGRIGATFFIVLDQFEEFFLYHGDDEIGRTFEEELAAALRRRDSAASVLVSIREDALARLDRLQGRIPGLLDNLLRLEHLDKHAARAAIERPLEHWNRLHSHEAVIEPALVEEVLAEVETGKLVVGTDSGAGRVRAEAAETRIEAPYLQLVLNRIWDEERAGGSRVLRLETLVRLGGAEHIVHTHLDQVLARRSRRDRAIAARVFRYLVTPSGTKIAHRPSDLADYAAVREERLAPILAALAGEARILRPAVDGAYEIYHDVLTAAVLDWRRRYEESRSRGVAARAIVLSAAAGIAAIVMVAYLGDVLDRWELRTVDARFSIRGAHVPNDVTVVAIDDATFGALRLQWPFPRRLHGRVIDRLRRDGARVIAYNIQFTEESVPEEDNALIEAVARARNVVLATTEVDAAGHTNIFGGDDVLQQLHARPGHTALVMSSGGVIRRIPWGTSSLDRETGRPGRKLESFALVAAEVATKRRITPAQLGGSAADIDYAGPAGTIRTFSFSDVLNGRFPRHAFRGKVVLVGVTAPSLQDVHPTPVADIMSGVEIQANGVHTALRGFPLRVRTGIDLALIALLSLIVPLASLRFGSIVLVGVAVAAGGLYVVGLQLAFDHHVLLPAVYPPLGLVLTTVLALGLRARRALIRRAGPARTR